jgi:threonine/homoserine/homoserine lactone efflux protein
LPSLEYLIPFVAATFVFAVMPGPAILYTAAQTIARGRRGGYLAAAGLHAGGLLHVAAAAAGLAAIFRHVPEAYAAVKLAGAVYLVWLGIGILRGSPEARDLPPVRDAATRRAFIQSVTVEILNPKSAVFFLAFLPQFVDPGAALPVWGQLLALGWIVNLAFSAGDLATIWLTSAMLSRLRRSGLAQRPTRLMGGGLLIGLGAHLALARD